MQAFAPGKSPIRCAGLPRGADYPVLVFRWFASSQWAGGSLTAASCGATTKGDPAVAILATPSPSALPGAWTCVG